MPQCSISVSTTGQTNWGALAIALAPGTSSSAIAFDNATAGGFDSTASSHTFAYSVGASANYLLIGVIGDMTSDLLTGVTYNAVAMAQLVKFLPASGVGWMYWYGLVNPASGSHNVVISASGNCTVIGGEAASYSGASAVQPNASASAVILNSFNIWTILTPITPGCWGVQLSRNVAGTGVTGVASGGLSAATRISEVTDGLASIVDTNGVISEPTSITLVPNSTQWQLQRFDLKPRSEEHL